jgi:hypothetical protein
MERPRLMMEQLEGDERMLNTRSLGRVVNVARLARGYRISVTDGTKVALQPALSMQAEVKGAIDALRVPGAAAPQPDMKAFDYATKLFARLADLGAPRPSVVPAAAGGIQFEWHTRNADVEIEVLAPRRIDVYGASRQDNREVAAEDVDINSAALADAIQLLR